MENRFLVGVLLWQILLAFAFGVTGRAAAGEATEIWKNETFIKRAETIKEGKWDEVTTRDVALVQLFEIGRMAEKVERRLSAQMDRFYQLAYRGALLLGVFLILHLVLTFAVFLRLGRHGAPGERRARGSSAEDFRL